MAFFKPQSEGLGLIFALSCIVPKGQALIRSFRMIKLLSCRLAVNKNSLQQ